MLVLSCNLIQSITTWCMPVDKPFPAVVIRLNRNALIEHQ